MLKSFNSLLIDKFNVSAQRTSCQNFFWHDGLVQEFFSYAYALAGYFFSKSPTHPPPPPLRSRMVGPLEPSNPAQLELELVAY